MKNESLSRWASIAEIVAAVGVILGLVFVGLQIKETNIERRATTIQAASDSQLNLMSELLRYADTWEKVVSGEDLNPGVERRRAIILFNLAMTENGNLFHQYQSGLMDEENWRGRVDTFHRLISLPIYVDWKNSIGGSNHSDEYLEYLESLRE